MIRPSRCLSARDLAGLAELERRTVAADGGRLKLEWEVLRSRRESDVHQLLTWRDDKLIGFIGLYAFGPPTVELAGAVDPDHRRQGIGSELLAAALDVARARGFATALLVTPRDTPAGQAFARSRHGVLEHSEHALVQRVAPPRTTDDPRVALRQARADDVPTISRIIEAGFGWPVHNLGERLGRTLVVEVDGEVVGTLRAPLEATTGSIYGFAVLPERQGRGIGREALRQACAGLREQGATEIRLEVAVDNDRALGLYTSLGFEPVATEDYFELAVSDVGVMIAP